MGNHFQVVSFQNVIQSFPPYYVNAVVGENVNLDNIERQALSS